MQQMTIKEAQRLEKEASENDGRCTHCGSIVRIYSYPVSQTMVLVLKRMAEATIAGKETAIDVEDLGLKHSQRSQLSKLRFHALIAKVKENQRQKARHWIVTKKGWEFLKGADIPAGAIIYNNQVLGHTPGMTNIRRVTGKAGEYQEESITEPEAKIYANARKPQRYMIVRATFRGRDLTGKLQIGQSYELQIKRLEVGRPVVLTAIDTIPTTRTYIDIAAFQREWKVNK